MAKKRRFLLKRQLKAKVREPEKERGEVLSALSCVDYVTIFDEDDPRELLAVIKPNVHVKSKTGFLGIEKDVILQNGGRIVLLDDIPGKSTTNLINKILAVYKQP